MAGPDGAHTILLPCTGKGCSVEASGDSWPRQACRLFRATCADGIDLIPSCLRTNLPLDPDPMRQTKIICTIGPATASSEMLRELAENGMNVARLNMSHGSHVWHGEVISHLKRLNQKLGMAVAILLDTKGPEVRTGDLSRDLPLRRGDQLVLTVRRQAELEPYTVEVSHDNFVNEVAVGDTVLIDGGMLTLKVQEIVGKDIRCRCLDDGLLSSRRHVNIRGKSAHLPSITAKDWQDIRFGIEHGVDFIALSFVRQAEAITELRRYLQCENAAIDILAKIEGLHQIVWVSPTG